MACKVSVPADKILQEIEYLRKELYEVVKGDRELLKTQETCEVSRRLDKLIVQHMYLEQAYRRTS